MNAKLKKALTNWRIILAIIFIVLAVIAIHPVLDSEGVTIRTISKNSSAELAGMTAPKPTLPPVSKERIVAVNQIPIKSVEDYYTAIKKFNVNDSQSKTIGASTPASLGLRNASLKDKGRNIPIGAAGRRSGHKQRSMI